MGFLAQIHEMQSVCLPENLVKLQLSQQQNYLVQKLERRKISQNFLYPPCQRSMVLLWWENLLIETGDPGSLTQK